MCTFISILPQLLAVLFLQTPHQDNLPRTHGEEGLAHMQTPMETVARAFRENRTINVLLRLSCNNHWVYSVWCLCKLYVTGYFVMLVYHVLLFALVLLVLLFNLVTFVANIDVCCYHRIMK